MLVVTPVAARWRRWKKRRLIARSERIIIGSGGTGAPAWTSTDVDELDVTRREAFAQYWSPGTRQAFLAEHVWEHLDSQDAARALVHCFAFLRPGGWLRLAVPDGFHPSPKYIGWVRPGGVGPGSEDHRVLYDYLSLSASVSAAGFEVHLLEYWDEQGMFHGVDWDPVDGMVRRSARFDERNRLEALSYTSLILDGIRP